MDNQEVQNCQNILPIILHNFLKILKKNLI